MNNTLKEAITVLNQGGIIIYPTDTAFGIGCRIDNPDAVKKLFSLRKRPGKKAVPVLFDTISRVKQYTLPASGLIENRLIETYWPGAVTIILPANVDRIPSLVRGGGLTVGCRIPAHEVPLALIKGIDCPIIGTSANFHTEPTPYVLADVNPRLLALVDYLIPGTTSIGRESTVVDCSSGTIVIKRQGAVQVTEIKNI